MMAGSFTLSAMNAWRAAQRTRLERECSGPGSWAESASSASRIKSGGAPSGSASSATTMKHATFGSRSSENMPGVHRSSWKSSPLSCSARYSNLRHQSGEPMNVAECPNTTRGKLGTGRTRTSACRSSTLWTIEPCSRTSAWKGRRAISGRTRRSAALGARHR
jgi:hypothetical protein